MTLEMLDPIDWPLPPTLHRGVHTNRLLQSASVSPRMSVQQSRSEPGSSWTQSQCCHYNQQMTIESGYRISYIKYDPYYSGCSRSTGVLRYCTFSPILQFPSFQAATPSAAPAPIATSCLLAVTTSAVPTPIATSCVAGRYDECCTHCHLLCCRPLRRVLHGAAPVPAPSGEALRSHQRRGGSRAPQACPHRQAEQDGRPCLRHVS